MTKVTHYPNGSPVPDGYHLPDGRAMLSVGSSHSPQQAFVQGFREVNAKQWLSAQAYARSAGVVYLAPERIGADGKPESSQTIPCPYFAGCLAALYMQGLPFVSPEALYALWYLDHEWISNGWFIRVNEDIADSERVAHGFEAGFYPSAARKPCLPTLLTLAPSCAFSAALVTALEAELTGTVEDFTLEERYTAWKTDSAATVAGWREMLPALLQGGAP